MKEFEQWLKPKVYKLREGCKTDNDYDCMVMFLEAGWRAALEGVLKQVDQSNSDGSIIDWIREELKDERI